MNAKTILTNWVASFHLSISKSNPNAQPALLAYTASPQAICQASLSGELLTYYQHIVLPHSCLFGNRFFNIEWIALGEDSRNPDYLGLDCLPAWRESYQIFAQTLGEDLIFCDIREARCPVYGLISGNDRLLLLSDSLFDFLAFYAELTRLQAIEFNGAIFADAQFNLNPEFANSVRARFQHFSPDAQAGLARFMFS
ncbi:Uncharacterised protein [Kingella potus]|uniref:Knr4/Smi1-like domain-containing protein n=1 Tax=Kingella potus TaxID=265175 RepID=A0A377QZ25_9NEIS|nr:hypothetical protein [Kingella potus]UOP01435.1 hypothetical protein LVJ84_04300 [Kingella potus]STR00242.1 Uncharacterised protein [Kingella potus]